MFTFQHIKSSFSQWSNFVVINKRKMDSTLAWLNSQHRSIKFTSELENRGKLPFLDLMVIRNGTTLDFDRKPTFSQRFITSDSFHNFQHKMAAFHSMANRLVSIPLNEGKYTTERNYIIERGKINGYDNKTIDNIIKVHERKSGLREVIILSQRIENDSVKRVSVPFDPTVCKELSKTYRKVNYQMVNSNEYFAQKQFKGTKDKISISSRY